LRTGKYKSPEKLTIGSTTSSRASMSDFPRVISWIVDRILCTYVEGNCPKLAEGEHSLETIGVLQPCMEVMPSAMNPEGHLRHFRQENDKFRLSLKENYFRRNNV
jgi:hypothetical protein